MKYGYAGDERDALEKLQYDMYYLRHQDLRPDHLFGRRMEMLVLAVLGQLRATNPWHAITREWSYGDPPATELGRAEAAFFARDRR